MRRRAGRRAGGRGAARGGRGEARVFGPCAAAGPVGRVQKPLEKQAVRRVLPGSSSAGAMPAAPRPLVALPTRAIAVLCLLRAAC